MQQNFALATKTLPNVWNCFEFLGLQKKILSQITFFWEKILNSDSFSDFVPKAPSRLSKLCWACPEELQKTKCFSPKQLCFHFSQNSGKNLSVELHSACPMQLLWIFQKIVTLNLLFCLGGTKSGYWQISCGRVVKTASDFAEENLDEQYLHWKKIFSDVHFRILNENFAVLEEKSLEGCRVIRLASCLSSKSLWQSSLNIIFSCIIIRLWAKLSWTSVRKFR